MSSIMTKQVDRVNHLSEADVLELMHSIMHLVRSRQPSDTDTATSPGGVGPVERKALAFFAHHPGATQSDLVLHSGRDKGQIARLLANLKERDLLDSQPDASDGRVTRLFLSDKARALYKEVQIERRALTAQALNALTPKQALQLQNLLLHIVQNLTPAQE